MTASCGVAVIFLASQAGAQEAPAPVNDDASNRNAAPREGAQGAGAPENAAVPNVEVPKAEEGGAATSKEGRFAIIPFAAPSYSPETSFLIGGAAIGVYRFPKEAERRDSQVTLALAASVKKQITTLLQPDIYLWDDRVQVGGALAVSRFPSDFYGIGNDAGNAPDEKYTPVTVDIDFSPKLRLLPGMYLGPDVRFEYVNVTDAEPGLLRSGAVPGAGGGRLFELGVSGFYDTRDNTIYPRKGHILKVLARTASTALGSEFSFDTLTVDARKYFTLPWGNHVLAFQALAEFRNRSPPFYELGLLGGDQSMRGYFKGQYRDRDYFAAQVEYRMPLFWRLGAVGFVSAGEVARAVSDIRWSNLKVAGGGGLRLAPIADVPVNIRLDVAYGDDLRFYVNVGEAF